MRQISDDTRLKMRLAKLGKPGNTLGKRWKIKDTSKMHHCAWNKGIPMSEAAKKKMIAKKIGKPSGRVGKKLSRKQRNNLRISHLGQEAWNKGKECPQLQGINHWNWQGGKSDKTKERINKLSWKLLRRQVYERDGWSCKLCKKHCNGDIQCHHIKLWESEKDDNIDNLVTLCKACHLKIHHALRNADITTKFNPLLSYLESYGLLNTV